MQYPKRNYQQLITLSASFLFCFMPLGKAEVINQNLQKETSFNQLEFNPPPLPDNERPDGRTRGGASRDGACSFPPDQPPLTALVPSSQEATIETSPTSPDSLPTELVYSQTTQEYPSFWFYLPVPLGTGNQVIFVLTDQNQDILYETHFVPANENAGIIQVSLPNTQAPLRVGESYQWFFLISCDNQSFEEVQGWVERITLDTSVQTRLSQATPREKAAIYAENGIWQDSLTLLGEHYRRQPQDATAQQDWQDFLRSAGLESVANEALLACCSPDQGVEMSTP